MVVLPFSCSFSGVHSTTFKPGAVYYRPPRSRPFVRLGSALLPSNSEQRASVQERIGQKLPKQKIEVLHFHDWKRSLRSNWKECHFESFWWFYWSSDISDNMHSRATLEEMLVKEGGELRVHSEPKRYVTCEELPLETWAHRIQRHSADYFVVDKPAGVPCAPHVSNGRSLAARREATGMPMV